MQIGNYQLSKVKEQPTVKQEEVKLPKDIFTAVTIADSVLYTGYNLPYYNPNKLYQKKGGYDVFDSMREDDQVSAVLNLIKFIILGAEWDIECEDEEIVEFLKYNFNNLDEIFVKKLYNILSALDYGFSLTEIIFKQQDGKILLSKLPTRTPHYFLFKQDQFGNVQNVIQEIVGVPKDINYDKFIHFAYQSEFDNPYGKSAMNEGVYRAWWSKNAIIKFWNIYLERHGMPLGIGTYPKGSTSGKGDLEKIGKNLQAKTFAVLPEGFMIDFKEASKGTDNYERAIDKYNMMIARAMLVPDLLGFSGGETGGGSYALGEKQFEMFYTIVNFVRRQLERIVTQKLIKPLVQFNFGSNIEAEFKFVEADEQRKTEMLKLWLDAAKSGKIPVTDTHINWFLQNVDAPEIEESELAEINAKKEEMENAIKDGQGGMNDKKKEENKNPNDKAMPPKPPIKNEKEFKVFSYNGMELTQYEKKVDFVQIENDLNSLGTKYKEDLGNMYKLSINALVDEIKRKKIIEKKRFDLVNGLSLKYESKIKKIYKDMLKDAFSQGKTSAVKKYIIDSSLVLDDNDIAAWIESYAYEYSAAETNRILDLIKPAVTEGIRSGSSVQDIIKAMDESLKSYDTTYDKNIYETIVRTVSSTGYNEGRAQQFAGLGDAIVAYQYSAILDGRETPLCHSLHGKILRPSEISKYNPPNHFNALLPDTKIRLKRNNKSVLDDIQNIKKGDLVLTNTGKYRRVYDTMVEDRTEDIYKITLEDDREIFITGDHPIFTKNGWKDARELNGTEQLRIKKTKIERLCKHCGKELKLINNKKYNKLYCNQKCMAEDKRKHYIKCLNCGINVVGSWKGKAVTKDRKFCSRRCYLKYKGRTSIEVKLAEILDELNITYKEQEKIGKYIVDFVVPEYKIILEADGNYWHTVKERWELRTKRDKFLVSMGYKVYHLGQDKILDYKLQNELKEIFNVFEYKENRKNSL